MLWENIRIALIELWANRTRSFLAMLGIFIATAATISVISIVLGFNAYIGNVFLTFKDTLFLGSRPPEKSDKAPPKYTPLRFQDVEGLQPLLPEIKGWAFLTQAWGKKVTYLTTTFPNGVLEAFTYPMLDLMGAKTSRGAPFNEQTVRTFPNACWTFDTVGEKLNLPGDPIGKVVEIDGHRFTIVGTSDYFSKMDLRLQRPKFFIAWETSCRVFGTPKNDEGTLVLGKDPEVSMNDAKAAVIRAVRRTHGLTSGDPNDFEVQTVEGEQQAVGTFIMVSGAILFAIVGISLLVGGIGIMNIMLVSVRERTKEIGVRMAVGARRRDILMQFITESITLCCIGGGLGILTGYTLGVAITRLLGVVAPLFGSCYFSPGLIAGSLAFSGGVGIFFGVLPARDASRLDPIEALRYE